MLAHAARPRFESSRRIVRRLGSMCCIHAHTTLWAHAHCQKSPKTSRHSAGESTCRLHRICKPRFGAHSGLPMLGGVRGLASHVSECGVRQSRGDVRESTRLVGSADVGRPPMSHLWLPHLEPCNPRAPSIDIAPDASHLSAHNGEVQSVCWLVGRRARGLDVLVIMFLFPCCCWHAWGLWRGV